MVIVVLSEYCDSRMLSESSEMVRRTPRYVKPTRADCKSGVGIFPGFMGPWNNNSKFLGVGCCSWRVGLWGNGGARERVGRKLEVSPSGGDALAATISIDYEEVMRGEM